MLLFGSRDISTGKSSAKPQKMLWGYPHSRQCDGQEISRLGGGGGCSCTPPCRMLHALEIELHELKASCGPDKKKVAPRDQCSVRTTFYAQMGINLKAKRNQSRSYHL